MIINQVAVADSINRWRRLRVKAAELDRKIGEANRAK
jgi:hypothetical protein